MHRIFDNLERFTLHRQPHQVTLLDERTVAKAVRCSEEPQIRYVYVDGVSPWRDFHWLTGPEQDRLGLSADDWLLAVRPFTPGASLDQLAIEKVDVLDVALQLAYRLRDLHEIGVPHGDVQPGNVVVHQGDVWLIDVAPTVTRPGEDGHVAGSAPLMAPELWSAGAPSTASDVYAFATLLVWMYAGEYPLEATGLAGWANAHRDEEPMVRDLPTSLSGPCARALQKEPDARPSLQALIDALRDAGASADVPSCVAATLPTFDAKRFAVELASNRTHLQICGPPRSGRTWAARRVQALLAERRVSVVFLSPEEIAASVADEDDAWRAVRALLDRLPGRADAVFPELRGGDRLHAFERLSEAVLQAVGDDRVVVLWDDFDSAGVDTRAWWQHFVDAVARRKAHISTAVCTGPDMTTHAIRVDLDAVDQQSWDQWRGQTLRTEVRDISQARWTQLVSEHGDVVGGLLGALDREIGSRAAARIRARKVDTGTLVSMQQGWQQRVQRLLDQCAFVEVAETCSLLHRNLSARGAIAPATERQLLESWTTAVVAGGGAEYADELDATLDAAADSPALSLLHARLLNALGRHTDGLDALDGVTSEAPAEQAELASWRAQLSLMSGRFEEATDWATRGLEHAEHADERTTAHLRVLAHAAGALSGEREAIEELESLAPRLERADVPAILKARLHAYRAIGLTRLDALDEATDAHLRALEQIETGGLSAELPTYLLNVGTAYHRQGRLGLAREYYARGVRIAQPTTRASTRALLFANQANVDLALGRLDEARNLVERGESVAQRNDLSGIVVMCRSVRGDIELASGRTRDAAATYQAILRDGDELGMSSSQGAEIRLALAEAGFQANDVRVAARWLDEARREIEAHQLADLENLQGMLRARLQWAEGSSVGTMAGIEQFRRNLIGAHDAGDHRLVLRQVPHLLEKLRSEGLDELLREILDVARDARNAIAMGLGRELRRDFFANLPQLEEAEAGQSPAPAAASTQPRRPAGGSPDETAVEPFYRMLSLNEVILQADALDEMLPDALDIALSLSNAERGFILLRDEDRGRIGRFEVVASRDVDGEAIPSPHLEVSLTIAEEAARTGRTVVTLNAAQDGRFSEALSVVDLDLTSVLCVPIRDGSGLLGALYVDHRFRPGVFEGGLPRMMEAFGHQLALAITNARRIEELESTRTQLSELLEERETMLQGLERRVGELTDQVEQQRAGASLRSAFPDIAFGSRAMEKVLGQVERVARGDIPVVVTGESGVGKELIARAIHDASPRRSGPFVAFNCGAVSESLFESEMFGHIKGAFTGADVDRQGLFHAASGGTIFLDEIGEMPLSMQVKLLRVLQERQIRRVGEAKSTPVDIRVVAATNRDLMEMVDDGTFREDLYYRLAAFVIEIPALRDRRDDIPLIASTLLAKIAEESARDVKLTAEGARLLMRCAWQGNVRQLENTLRAAAVMADSDELGEAELAPLVQLAGDSGRSGTATSKTETRGRRLKATRFDVVEALRRANDDREKAAELLGVSERTMYRYMKRWDLY